MALVLQRPEEIVSSGLARWGIYGENGVGKTTFLTTIPTHELPLLVVSADDENVKPLRGMQNVAIAKVTRWDDLAEVLKLLQDGLLLRDGRPDPDVLSGKKKFFRVVAFDTWSRLQGLAIHKVTGYEIARPGQEINYLTHVPKTPRDFREWGQVGALSSEWARYFMRLPIHTIFLFQENTREPKFEGDPIVTAPALTPEALRGIKEALELIGRLYVVRKEPGDGLPVSPADRLRQIDPTTIERRMLLLGKHERYFAKGPTHALGYVVEDPTWARLAASLSAAPTRAEEG